jgi:NAD(P)H-nitrite reductase large subunit
LRHKEEHLIIIGNGIAGITAAIETRKRSSITITVISSESKYFYSRTALMYVYMGQLKLEHTKPYPDEFWKQNNIQLVQDYVSHIDVHQKLVRLQQSDSSLTYSKLILASGSKPKMLQMPNTDAKGVFTFHHLQDVISIDAQTNTTNKKAVIVGGGLIGVELAEMLLSRQIPVTQIVREELYWSNVLPRQEASMVAHHIQSRGVKLLLDSTIEAIHANENNEVTAVSISGADERITCDLLFIAIGVKPNIHFLKESGIAINDGILVNEFLETTIKDVYAIGDCAEHYTAKPPRNTIDATWYTGKIMGATLAQTITGNKTAYQQNQWYNSAKFFDIEYHTYGTVGSKPYFNNEHFNWNDTNRGKSFTIEYQAKNRTVKGINTLGIQLRQQVVNSWLDEGVSIDYLINHIAQACFHSEFEKRYFESIQVEFNRVSTGAVN